MRQTFKEWIRAQYELDELKDITEHGCVSGCAHGAIYYSETRDLYDRFSEEIWDRLHELSFNHGETILQCIANFNGAKNVGGEGQFKNLLVWFYIEEIAFELLQDEEVEA